MAGITSRSGPADDHLGRLQWQAGQPSALEERIQLEAVELKRHAAIRQGMEKAAQRGQHIGRPAQAQEAFLVKYAAVREALADGLSLRQAATRTGVAVNTVRKVQKLIGVR